MNPYFIAALFLTLTLSLPNQRPIIGIYTLPDEGDEPKSGQPYPPPLKAGNYTYIAASYVRYIEMSGAQVVPIYAFSSQAQIHKLLTQINGVLFTGGGTSIDISNKWTKNADFIVQYALTENKKGNVFPVWGTCLGWQLLSYLTSGYDSKWLTAVRGQSGVRNTISIKSSSYLYDGISDTLSNNLQQGQGIVYFNHVWAVSTKFFQLNQKFNSFWKLISSTKSSYNEQFVSTAQGREYPFYGVQYHPQKNLYEWKVFADRSNSGVQIVQILSNKFVQKARLNNNQFVSDTDFRKIAIYNFKTQPTTMSFTSIYLFHEVQAENESQQKGVKNLMMQ